MPNNQIANKQAQIENARAYVRASRIKIADFEKQLQNIQRGSKGQQQKDVLLRQWDDEMDLLDNYLMGLESQISGFLAVRNVQNYSRLQARFSGLKSAHRSIAADLKKAKDALTKIEGLEKRAVLELNEAAHQRFLAEIDLKIQVSVQKIKALQRQNPVDNDALAAEQAVKAALSGEKQTGIAAYSVKEQALAGIVQTRTSKESKVSEFSRSLAANARALEMNLQEISQLNDPRYLVNRFDDNTPFLLLPVRVETRYMDIKHVRRVIDGDTASPFSIPDRKELWVRIFPDDIAIHSHEKRLTADEENAGQTYWKEFWRAFVAGETDPKLGPWRVLAGAYGPERAAWIVKQTEPTNLDTTPPSHEDLIFPALDIKLSAWSEAAKSYVLPDRFVVRLYSDETNYREIVGGHIPDPLQMGMNPSEEVDGDFEQLEGAVKFPEEIKWLTDFKEAKNVGMGIAIPLEPQEEAYIHRILVLGLKLSADKKEATGLFEELVENHHYTTGGFSLIPQGTPTNNTEGLKSGYERMIADPVESLKTEVEEPLFSNESGLMEKSDGQWFADLMGINQETVQHVFHANGTDICEAIAMNRALWPATMGYFMKQMLHPHISTAERNRTRDFFNEYVLGRGKIPAFRVDNQPYGVITSTAFSRWNYGGSISRNDLFYGRLNQNILKPMSAKWGEYVSHVKHVELHNEAGDPSQDFLDIVGLHASSVEFHQRFANGGHNLWNLWRFLNYSDATVPDGFPVIDSGVLEEFLDSYSAELGVSMAGPPKIFELNFLVEQRLLNGPVIDGFKALPYSEIRGIQPFPDTGWNYIHWLRADTTTISKIRAEDFDNIPGVAPDQKPPKALLYLLLRHAYLQVYLNTSTRLLFTGGKVTTEAELEIELQGIVATKSLSEEEKAIVLKAVTEEVTIAAKLQIKRRVQQEFSSMQNVPRHQVRSREGRLFKQMQSNIRQQIDRKFNSRLSQYQSNQLKWDYLTRPVAEVSGTDTMEEFLDGLVLSGHVSVLSLTDFKEALEKLEGLPTARLERAFAEHLDLCNYRLDAWMTGLVNERLEKQQSTNKGIYLGAFGMLEALKPNTDNPGIHIVEVDGSQNELPTSSEVENAFHYIGDQPPIPLNRDSNSGKIKPEPGVDPTNQGFIHTPSVNHAVTAAILRAGYLSHKQTDSDDDTLAVNLTSQRVKRALYYLEGIQNGQSLAAMLGYRFERELHERPDDFGTDLDNLNLDQYILDFRLKYPLTTGSVIPKDETTSVETQEASNVLDGLALLNDYDTDETIISAFLATLNEGAGVVIAAEVSGIFAALDNIQNDMDAIADLLLSESVYQLAKGNVERSGAVLKVLGEGGYIQEPEIIKTPRQGAALTHRFGIEFDQSLSDASIWTAAGTPRSHSEPTLNGWLAKQLPHPATVLFNVSYNTVSVDEDGNEIVTENPLQLNLNDLEIEPIDFVHFMGDQGGSQDAAELSTRIAYYIIENEIEEDGIKVSISYTDTTGINPDTELSLFQILPLVKELKKVIGNSRPLTYEDYLLAANAQVIEKPEVATYLTTNQTSERLKKVAGLIPGYDHDLTTLIADLGTKITGAEGLVYPADPADPVDPANESTIADLRTEILKGAWFGVSNIYPSSVFDYSEAERDNLVSIARRLKGILTGRLSKVDTLLDDLDTLTTVKAVNDRLAKAGEILFGRTFKVYPHFELLNAVDVELTRSCPKLHYDDVAVEEREMAVEEWLQGVAKVKPQVANYQRMRLYSDSLTSDQSSELVVTQLPLPLPGDGEDTDDVLENMRWIGMTLPENYDIPGDNLSLVLELPTGGDVTGDHAGMVLDEWVETIPYKEVHTGVAMHYNEPNAEAPNTLIMAVTPEVTGQWEWDDLMDTLNETLSLAKKRAVEPDQIKQKIWGQALPALIAAISSNDATPSLDFARNVVDADNGQYGHIAPADFAVE